MPQKTAANSGCLSASPASCGRIWPNRFRPGGDGVFQFRVTRNSDLAVDEEDVINLRMALRQGLHHRHYGAGRAPGGIGLVLGGLGQCAAAAAWDCRSRRCFASKARSIWCARCSLIDLVDDPALLFSPWKRWPGRASWWRGRSVMEQMRKGDVLIHQPFEDLMPCWSCCARR